MFFFFKKKFGVIDARVVYCMMIRADFVYNRDTHKGIHPWLDERKGGVIDYFYSERRQVKIR